MARHKLKLLALLAVLAVAPASAGHRIAMVDGHDGPACPYERARSQAMADAAPGDTVVTLTSRVPSLAERAGFAAP